ncbi:MAG: hypothetical protein P8046_03445 [Anaerolineales bacterium]|jgi:hypothetical protein
MIFKRPWILFVTVIVFTLFSLVEWVRFFESIRLWRYLASLNVAVLPLYQAITGFFWGSFGLGTVVGLWLGKPWGRKAARILTVTYAGYYWIDQVFIGKSEIRSTNWPFLGGATVVLLVLVWGSLAFPAVYHFFGDDNDQKE